MPTQTQSRLTRLTAATVLALVAPMAWAQDAPDALRIYFDHGSTRIAGDQQAVLDQAARLYRDGQPYVMVVAGSADRTGNPATNLTISLQRAQIVAGALSDRGIPVERLQVLGRGNSDLPVDTADDVDEQRNRVVEITWR